MTSGSGATTRTAMIAAITKRTRKTPYEALMSAVQVFHDDETNG